MNHRSLTHSICAMLLFAGSLAGFAQDEKAETVCATVNGANITEEMVLNEINTIVREFRGQINPMLLSQKDVLFYSKAIERLVSEKLIRDVAAKENIAPDTGIIDKNIESLKGQFPSEAEFVSALQTQGMNEADLRGKMKDELVIQTVLEKKIEDPKTPTNEDLQTFYDENPDMFTQPEQVRASHILLRVDPKATDLQKSAVKAKLENIVKEIKDEKSTFADAAKQHSDDPVSGNMGGDLNYFPRGKMVPAFEEAAFTTKSGEMSDIIETQFGYHVIQVTDKKEGSKVPLDEVKEKLTGYLISQEKSKSAEAYIQSLRDKADVKEVLTSEAWKEMQVAKMQAQQKQAQQNKPKPSIKINPDELK